MRTTLRVAMAVVVVLMSACSTNARRVDCEWRLEPINQPAPKPSESPAPTSSGRREAQ